MPRPTPNDRGTIDILLLVAMLGLTLVPATILASTWDAVDAGAGRLVLYAAALAAGWKIYKAANVLWGLDTRLERVERRQIRIEEHIGLDPLPEDLGA